MSSSLSGGSPSDLVRFCCRCGEPGSASPCGSCGEEPRLEGRYSLVGELGRGAHGTTWRARDEQTGDAVAIKELPLRMGTPTKAVELFRREADVLRQLQHPGIPRCRDVIDAGVGRARALWLVLDLIEGQTLEAEARKRRYNEGEVLDIVEEVLSILQYLHGLSPPVVHRDIKPANLIRRADGGLVLVDFGSVRESLRSETGGSTVAGTFGFMAPEQYAGEAEPRTDLYGLGATAIALLTRKSPHQLHDVSGRLEWRAHANVSAAVGDLLARLVALEVSDRPRDVVEAREALRLVRAGGGATPPLVVQTGPAPPAPLDLPSPNVGFARIALSGSGRRAVRAADHAAVLSTAEHFYGTGLRFEPIGDAIRLSIDPMRGGRNLRISIEPVKEGSRILASEDLRGVVGGAFGGILGGVGGGVGGGTGFLFFQHLGPAGGTVFLVGLLMACALLAFGVVRSTLRNRTRQTQLAIEALEKQLGGSVVQRPRPALPAAGTTAFAAALAVALGTTAILMAMAGPLLGISVPWGYLGLFAFFGVVFLRGERPKRR